MLDPNLAAQALRDWCDKRGTERGVTEFLGWLEERNGLFLLPVIRKQLQQMQKQDGQKNQLQAETARGLSDQQQLAIADAFKTTPEHITQTVRDNQIAGVDVTHKGEQVRGSVAAQLSQLRKHLTSNL